ncbi:MAG: GNAT family N-acetyltransferase [Bacteroidetes bacterium RIFCSPLOWO2_02_FULL_36_8]|nr:MAG: GNAT family N-acetyltransferase [Bacteroidetes bacterium RIFCSPLOWO2_02_FULL_36_8]OFY69308.1 MAG: GNAT family N-acetyltransferase [Bacteroidetes bacterium RIFCSPLOWO2_12_FULL_37_12]
MLNTTKIVYKIGTIPLATEICRVFTSSGIKRPVNDPERISRMFREASLVVTAYDDNLLVGIARALTDHCYCCYLSDLAIANGYQKKGIGKELINIVKKEIGDKCSLILLSVPTAMDYYPKVGFEKIDNGWIIKRRI